MVDLLVRGLVLVFFFQAVWTTRLVNPKNVDYNGMDSGTLQKVLGLAQSSSEYSWEIGTFSEAYTEYTIPQLSVYENTTMLPPSDFTLPAALTSIVAYVMQNRPSSPGNTSGSPLMLDGAAGDPASLGTLIMLANLSTETIDNYTSSDLATAAKDQYNYLVNTVPKTSDGAISHRVSEVSLWSDFVYMAPPFLAYYGVATGSPDSISEAYNQISLYRSHLQDTTTNLWRHIDLSSDFNDTGLWATGNGWAAAGIVRVIETIAHSSYSSQFQDEIADLTAWALEIVEAAFGTVSAGQYFPNYFHASEASSFPDASSTALLSAVVFRLGQYNLGVSSNIIEKAQKARYALYQDISSDNGQLYNVVDPLNSHVSNNGTVSPEGQSFVVLLETAWSDYLISQGQSASRTVTPSGSTSYRPSATKYTSKSLASHIAPFSLPLALWTVPSVLFALCGGSFFI